jgi:hypothetical protein
MHDAARLIHDVEHARSGLIAAASGLTDAQAAFKPAADQWCVAEVLEHLYLAELSGIAKIWAANDAARAGAAWSGARPNHGKSIEEIVAATWKVQEVAPPIATPHIGGPLQFWLAATRSLEPVLSALGAQLGDANLEDVVFPHFLSGPLDARQRLQFLRFHIQRHTSQVERIIGAMAPHRT